MSDEVHLYDVGTIIRVTIKENNVAVPLAGATVLEFLFERKDRSTFKVDAIVEDEANGIVYCVSTVSFFTIKGDMDVQIHLVLPTGEWRTSIGTFTVNENINVTA